MYSLSAVPMAGFGLATAGMGAARLGMPLQTQACNCVLLVSNLDEEVCLKISLSILKFLQLQSLLLLAPLHTYRGGEATCFVVGQLFFFFFFYPLHLMSYFVNFNSEN